MFLHYKAYTKKMFGCLKKLCNDIDFQIILSLATLGCPVYNIDITGDVAVYESGTAGTGTTTGGASGSVTTLTTTAEAKTRSGRGFPVGGIVGIVLAVLAAVVIGAFIGCFCIRNRRKAQLNQNHRPITTPPQAQHSDPAHKPETVVKWIPQPASDMYPPVLDPSSVPQYQMAMPAQSPPQLSLPPHLAKLHQQTSTNTYTSSSPGPVSFPLVQLPHTTNQYHAELPTGSETRRT
jgi:hypothetical protein